MMAGSGTGAVFFLGTRAHYQVLQQPSQCDVDNANIALDNDTHKGHEKDGTGTYTDETLEMGTGVKRRRGYEVERDQHKKATQLNINDETPKKGYRSRTVLSCLLALGRRSRTDSYRMRAAVGGCSYRESCRCLDCQSSYFDCDESDDSCDNDYDTYDYNDYSRHDSVEPAAADSEDDDEVFTAPSDTTSADLLIEGQGQPQGQVKMSTSSDEVDDNELQIEVAAGTPVFLNYLLTHPVTCCIQ